ncbi:hypothetical protein BDP27DRAFT_1373019 [Rhodocollybia butyracea]|uniref:Uncharacterized protein n=1 Tax=Rhodocollybia butyracea TaxID=206335 RepID=A0A9P5P7B3_9AGAR|nr:hypothetical protein BDP27DRAFT_1373019 [Rhodocollybia butyracea]
MVPTDDPGIRNTYIVTWQLIWLMCLSCWVFQYMVCGSTITVTVKQNDENQNELIRDKDVHESGSPGSTHKYWRGNTRKYCYLRIRISVSHGSDWNMLFYMYYTLSEKLMSPPSMYNYLIIIVIPSNL